MISALRKILKVIRDPRLAAALSHTGMLLAGALVALFYDLNPAALFIGGIACTFLGTIHFLSLGYGPGVGVSASDTSDAIDLVRANDRDATLRNAQGLNDHI